jgi:hypothetical protein
VWIVIIRERTSEFRGGTSAFPRTRYWFERS